TAFAGGQPTIESIDQSGTRVFAAGTACPFTLQRVFVSENGTLKTFPADASGDVRQIVTGKLTVTYTNLDNGRSLTADISGPLIVFNHSDGTATVILLGHAAEVFYPTDTPPGPKTFINAGRVVINSSGPPNFDFTLVSESGNELNVCTALA